MISFLLQPSSFFNFIFFIFAVGFVIALGIEQVLKFSPLSVDASMNERNQYIVRTNRKYCWRQAWAANLAWFLCNLALFFMARNMQAPVDTFWNGL